MSDVDPSLGAAAAIAEVPDDAAPGGRFMTLGLSVAALACAIDQAAKLFMLYVYELGERGVVSLAPVLDLVLAWNTGISYGMLAQQGDLGRWLLVGFKLVAVTLLILWLARVRSKPLAIALGLIIGGAVGNTIDRVVFGAVVDFLLLRPDAVGLRFPYVFNLADTAITIGVLLMLYDALVGERAAKAPR